MDRKAWAKDFSALMNVLLGGEYKTPEKEQILVKFCKKINEQYPDMQKESWDTIQSIRCEAEEKLAQAQ